jgi:FlgD Ig-like domain
MCVISSLWRAGWLLLIIVLFFVIGNGTIATVSGLTIEQIRDPAPNLTWFHIVGWDYPLVPRDVDDATLGDVRLTPFLPGRMDPEHDFWWNYSIINQGEGATEHSFRNLIFTDGDSDYYVGFDTIWSSMGEWIAAYNLNLGPVRVYGGRHTLELFIDSDNDIAEYDETDNNLAYQFVWNPDFEVYYGGGKAPDITGGWESIPAGEDCYYNCKGYRIRSTNWWTAAAIMPRVITDDVDCRLHPPSTGSLDGFTTYYAWSSRPAGYTDAVIVNRNNAGEQDWDVGIFDFNGSASGDEYHYDPAYSETLTIGSTETFVWDYTSTVELREFYVDPLMTGWIHAGLHCAVSEIPAHLIWLAEDFSIGTLDDCSGSTTANSEGIADLYMNVTSPGYHCLGLYHDGPLTSSNHGFATISLDVGHPDFKPDWRDGWYSPCVPRPDTEGNPMVVAMPDTLYGDDPSTRFNTAMWNESPVPYEGSSPNLRLWVEYDARTITWYYIESLGGYGANVRNSASYTTIPGGRHTFSMILDKDENIEEQYEDNNRFGEQFCWSPVEIPLGTAVTRPGPSDPSGGWDTVTYPVFYNCDGLRVSGEDGWWNALAVMPTVSDSGDVDVRLHDPLEGTKIGFAGNLAWSTTPGDASDFVLINYNQTEFEPYDMGVLEMAETDSYRTEAVTSDYLGDNPIGIYGPFTLASGQLLQLYEFALDPDLYRFRLENLTGDVDLGVSLYPFDTAYHDKWSTVDGCVSWLEGSGGDEEFIVDITEEGYYCLAVWKVGAADAWQEGSYQIAITRDVSGVAVEPVADDPAAQLVNCITEISPNPCHSQTTIAFDLAMELPVSLTVYDATGRTVRQLINNNCGTGHYRETWDGRNDGGSPVASGAYFVRLLAGERETLRKVVVGR